MEADVCGRYAQSTREGNSMISPFTRRITTTTRVASALGLFSLLLAVTVAEDRCLAQAPWQGNIGNLDKALIANWPGRIVRSRDAHPIEHQPLWIDDTHVQPVVFAEPTSKCCKQACGRKVADGGECEHSPCHKCPGPHASETSNSVQANETARAVLDIMDALGRSVIEGTEFEPETVTIPEELPTPLSAPADIRSALIKYIHALEAERNSTGASSPLPVASDVIGGEVWVQDEAPPAVPDDVVNALRQSSWSLDEAAAQLEMLELYDRADQVRSLAQELRHDARRMKSGRVVHARRHATPVVAAARSNSECSNSECSEIETARRQLRLMRDAMRHETQE